MNSENSIVSFEDWLIIDDNIQFKEILVKYKDLKYMNAPTTSFLDKFLLAKSRLGTLQNVVELLDEHSSNMILYKLETNVPIKQPMNNGFIIDYVCIIRYAEMEN